MTRLQSSIFPAHPFFPMGPPLATLNIRNVVFLKQVHAAEGCFRSTCRDLRDVHAYYSILLLSNPPGLPPYNLSRFNTTFGFHRTRHSRAVNPLRYLFSYMGILQTLERCSDIGENHEVCTVRTVVPTFRSTHDNRNYREKNLSAGIGPAF